MASSTASSMTTSTAITTTTATAAAAAISVGTGRCQTEISNVPDMFRPMSRSNMSKGYPSILL